MKSNVITYPIVLAERISLGLIFGSLVIEEPYRVTVILKKEIVVIAVLQKDTWVTKK